MDIDGNWSYDLTGSYGVNIFGYDFYKRCIEKGFERVKKLGPVLGAYHRAGDDFRTLVNGAHTRFQLSDKAVMKTGKTPLLGLFKMQIVRK